MRQVGVRVAALLAAMLAAWQPPSARAAGEDTQVWVIGFVRGELADGLHFTLDTSLRLRTPTIGPDQQTLRITLEQEVAPRLRLGGGGAVFETASQTELRPHQQLRYLNGGLDLRTRFEQRLFPGAARAELRYRQRVQYTQRLGERVALIGSGEWFSVVQARDPGGATGTEQVRLIVAAAIGIGGGFELQPGYLLILAPRGPLPDRISHVPQLTINSRF